jgi:hypothetical protein
MNTITSKLISALSSFVLLLSISGSVYAEELNFPGFSGSINTTVTSGISLRTDRDCLSVRGSQLLPGDNGRYASAIALEQTTADQSVFLSDGDGCAKRYTDGYGNTGLSTSGARSLIGANADNGRTNFDNGDVFDVTQRVFSEIVGNIDDGTSVNLSFVGTYNPVVDVNGNPDFAPFTSKQQDDIESSLTLLNAYVSRDINMDHAVTVGRFVTSWGESTFIPIGMNGLTTNALNLTKLRNPGSSIKEALIPTEQLTVQGYLNGGWSYEAYMQFNESHVELDEAGQFFGNEAASGDRLIISAQYAGNDQARAHGCGFLISMPAAAGGQAKGCTQAALDYYASAAGPTKSEMYLYDVGTELVFAEGGTNRLQLALKSGLAGAGAATAWSGSAGDIPTLGISHTAAVADALSTGWDVYSRKGGSKAGAVDLSGGNHVYADGEDQFGFSLRTFLPNVGTGVDLGFHFAQYDSKVPYLRLKGQQALVAGDLLGLFTIASKSTAGKAHELAAYMGAGTLIGSQAITLSTPESTGLATILGGLGNVAYSEAACGAYQKAAAANDIYGRGDASALAYSDDEVQLALQANNYTNIDGKLYFDSTKCFANAAVWGTGGTQAAAAALLGAAVTPLNAAEYEFIYPENLQAMGVSANTNIGSTAVQLEVTYRPDFPLGTDGTDQGQQLSDAAGTTTLLAHGVAKGYIDKGLSSIITSAYDAGNGGTSTIAGVLTGLKSFKRSNLPSISLATVAASDYYTTPFFEYDVLSGTLGTTTAYTASHPLTVAIGADSTVLLSEVGFVYVPDLTDARPVARGGYRDGVGGDKCGGHTAGGSLGASTFGGTTNAALVGATHLGSAQTDPLFGNGGYCEAKNNADEFAMTYRLIGSASYNNIANSPWNLSNSVVWSHDFNGYAPSSMGGFVPGKQSLSLSSTLTKGSVKASVSYVNQMGDEKDNLGFDMDYVSASVSYAF